MYSLKAELFPCAQKSHQSKVQYVRLKHTTSNKDVKHTKCMSQYFLCIFCPSAPLSLHQYQNWWNPSCFKPRLSCKMYFICRFHNSHLVSVHAPTARHNYILLYSLSGVQTHKRQLNLGQEHFAPLDYTKLQNLGPVSQTIYSLKTAFTYTN